MPPLQPNSQSQFQGMRFRARQRQPPLDDLVLAVLARSIVLLLDGLSLDVLALCIVLLVHPAYRLLLWVWNRQVPSILYAVALYSATLGADDRV